MREILIKTAEIEQDITGVIDFPAARFEEIIREVGFECDCCGKCCTSEFNDHVFLLDEDSERIIRIAGREALRPAPYFEFCDNLGRFYVMGYALKTKNGGDCIFFSNGACEHYSQRPDICRIFPYMLHREEDEDGNMDWRQIGGLNRHGLYNSKIGPEDVKKIAAGVKRYEIAFLKHKLAFIETIKEHFREKGLRHSQQNYDRRMREFKKGGEIEINIFFKGEFMSEKHSRESINYSGY